jgi:hypothetical protein
MKNAIKQYGDAGGGTNLLKGTAESIYTKLGTVKDPAFKSVAVALLRESDVPQGVAKLDGFKRYRAITMMYLLFYHIPCNCITGESGASSLSAGASASCLRR